MGFRLHWETRMYYLKLILLLVSTITLGWKAAETHAVNSRLLETTRVIAETARRPIAVVESPVITQSAELLKPWLGATRGPAIAVSGTTLVLLFGDESPESQGAATQWRELLEGYRNGRDRQLWVVTKQEGTNGSSLSGLADLGAAFFELRDSRAFTTATGVRTVPAALLFQGSDLVAMSSGHVAKEDIAVLARYFLVEGSVPASPFIFDKPGDDLNPVKDDPARSEVR